MTDTNKERAAFEAWYFAENDSRLFCESQWRAWKARAAKAPAAPTQASPDGWKWMTHPSRNGGLPIPVRVFAEDGVTYYQPFSEADCEFEWESRDSEWHEAAPPAPTEQWLSVADRLPDPFCEVIVYPRPSDYCCEASVDTQGQWSYSEYETSFGVNHCKCKVTHWKPMGNPQGAANKDES